MKLITLNSHSLEEPDYEQKLLEFVKVIGREKPDIIALQEVNQLSAGVAPEGGAPIPCASPYAVPCPVRADNHAFRAASLLSQSGLDYHWVWVPSKIGYDKYDEGLALFSRRPVLKTHQFYITDSQDYYNWKTRKILGITVDTGRGIQHFFTVHMGWWDDEQEPFARQWQRISHGLAGLPGGRDGLPGGLGGLPGGRDGLADGQIWLMGDFNSPAHIPGQGRDLIRSQGWLDTYELAARRDSGVTVDRAIDGWKQYPSASGMRIDYIWTNREIPVKSSQVLFNGQNGPVVSDHFGIMVEI